MARDSGEKITDELGDGVMIPAAECEGLLFNLPLPGDTGQRAFPREVLRKDGDKESRIGILTGPTGLGHTIGADSTRLCHGGQDVTAGTVAEGVRSSVSETVIRGDADLPAVLREIDILLPVLDAGTDGKSLAFHRNTLSVERFQRIARGMTRGKDNLITGNQFAVSDETFHSTILKDQTLQTRPIADLSAERDNLIGYTLNDVHQHVCAEVRFGIIKNRLGSTVLIEDLQHGRDA